MAIWFTADQHFGHANIIEFCRRPFGSVEDMDDAMIEGWNSVVGEEDDVWHLGDFAYHCGPNRMRDIFDRLAGRSRHLVRGSHDGKRALALPWASVQTYAELRIDNQLVVLCHYPFLEWNGFFRGSWSLHGHVHGRLPPTNARCDVGVDVWAFRPVSLDQIAKRLNHRESASS